MRTLGADKGWSLDFAWDVVQHATLPALSIILVSLGWWFLSMRSLMAHTTVSWLMCMRGRPRRSEDGRRVSPR